MAAPDESITPDQLARDLGLRDGRPIRAWLRAAYPRTDAEKHSRWRLTAEQAVAVKREFSLRAGR